jgi:hypothetical protein
MARKAPCPDLRAVAARGQRSYSEIAMYRAKLRLLVLFAVIFSLIATVDLGLAKPKTKKPIPKGTPVLWHRPDDVGSRDLYLGPGGLVMRPDLSRITFIEEERGGWSKKYKVRDGSGRVWVAKIGKEAQAETSAVRLLWGLGYVTEINYLVPRVEIPGKGIFQNVRFEARPKDVKRLDEWKWKQNPFVGTKEFQALKVMMVLLNNWDVKDSNNKILFAQGNSGDELRYIISDLGATFGHSSKVPIFWRIMRSRNNPKKYAKSDFVAGAKGNRVHFHYHGKRDDLFHDISIEDATWTGSLLSKLSDRQLRDAFRAANYTPDQINLLTNAVRTRTNELLNLRANERIGRSRNPR